MKSLHWMVWLRLANRSPAGPGADSPSANGFRQVTLGVAYAPSVSRRRIPKLPRVLLPNTFEVTIRVLLRLVWVA